jgi:hypothetical protein
MARELEKRGFVVREGVGSLTASSRRLIVHVNRAGYCWSTKDPSDLLVPLIPYLLEFPRQMVPAKSLAQLYFSEFLAGGVQSVRFHPRLETSSNWTRLRASGDCGLTPDEHLAVTTLVSSNDAAGPFVTDFPTDGSLLLVYGRKMYFQSVLSGREVESSLREVGERRPRNCYLPRDGVFTRYAQSMASRFVEVVGNVAAEWCFFKPSV